MLLKYFYDSALAHASYMVGCQRTDEAVIVDPGRDIQQYLDAAEQHRMRVTAVAETHIHADYVSGARELADRIGALLYLSDEGPASWKYQFADQYETALVKDGDSFNIGNIQFEVLHTPGHTPESVSFVFTDVGGGANKPMGIFTGDFVFVGSIGRPDLLEEAAGVAGSAAEGAKQLYQSVLRFQQLPDYLQLWPAHGAGSACGKGLGAIPSSTVGYEKMFNPALQFQSEAEFVQYILSDQPPAPAYFAVMKRVNKEGPEIVGRTNPNFLESESMDSAIDSAIQNGTVVDVASSARFAEAHVPRTINIPMGSIANWGGWLIDYERPIYFLCDRSQAAELQRIAEKMGMDSLVGFFDSSRVSQANLRTGSYAQANPTEIAERIRNQEVDLIDVRSDAEWNSDHIAEAKHHFLGKLPNTGEGAIGSKPIVMQCLGGGRSAIGASIMKSLGAEVINMSGGITAWKRANLPVTTIESCESETESE